MCFSANASFGAGIVLAAIGVATIKKATHPSQIIFCSIPLLFCVQQITEGLLWVSLTPPGNPLLQRFSTYTFLSFAQIIWPFYVPLAILLLKKKEKRKVVSKILVGIGAFVSLYMAFCLMSFHSGARIIGYHISYQQDYPVALGNYYGALYVIATIAPAFFSGIKRMWYLGAAILISYIITEIFYTDYIVSVWCFFASVISVIVFAIMYEIEKTTKESLAANGLNFTGYIVK
jgi:hypothetical protein